MKHKSLVALAVILAFSVGMTLISAKNYVSSLNTVAVLNTRSGTLSTQHTAAGFLHFTTTVTLFLPEGCQAEKTLAAPGGEVRAGDPLLQFSLEELHLCLLRLTMEREQLTARPGQSAAARELAELEVLALEEQMAALDVLSENQGTFVSPVRGQVLSISTQGTVELGLYDDGLYCTWEVPQSENRAFSSFSSVIGGKEQALSLERMGYDPTRSVYQYKTKPFSTNGTVNTTLPVEISLSYTSREYSAVLPRRCIRTDSDGSTFVFVVEEREQVYGSERYLRKVGVTVVEQDDRNAAVLSRLEGVVEYALRAPVELEAVKVME